MNDLALLLNLLGNSEETTLLVFTVIFFVWCLLRQQNGGLNSGQKSVNIVTDAYLQAVLNIVLVF